MSVAPDVEAALQGLVGRTPLLLALDFDGVCAPLVDDPEAARALPGTASVVAELAALDGVEVAMVSGRSLASLTHVSQAPAGVLLVGGHGAETGDGVVLPDDAAALLETITAEVEAIVAGADGTSVEHKPTSVVLHTRRADDEATASAQRAVLDGPGARDGVRVRPGHEVVELSVVTADKGQALRALRDRVGASAAVYVGDDVTDEDAFAVLDQESGDVAVKVGSGETRARLRVESPEDVTELLERLLDLLRTGHRG
ncbi:trehalose-phosphatase [Aquipuribacter nitratireducens]|uniref:Trehalose 6-phosphate phosphatase n=1 Tax=Aquipuribacter nitratireducens TaxID=650104 RepID=A0ABW0GM78_9MICO